MSSEKIIYMFERGKTYKQIGEAIGKTRNAIAGYIYKLRAKGVVVERITGEYPPVHSEYPPVHSEYPPVTIVDLTNTMCKFPTTDESPFYFCGEKISRGVYCENHAKICYKNK